MKLLIDMNLSRLWCETLQKAGYEALHWSEIGRADDPDENIMLYASENGFVVLTEDLDFGILLARNRRSGPSVVQLRTGMNLPRQIAYRVIEALDQTRKMLASGALVSIDSHSKSRDAVTYALTLSRSYSSSFFAAACSTSGSAGVASAVPPIPTSGFTVATFTRFPARARCLFTNAVITCAASFAELLPQ